MTKVDRQTIVLLAAAIGGGFIPNLFFSQPKPAQSSDCLQWANEAIQGAQQKLAGSQATERDANGYFDVRAHRDETYTVPDAQPQPQAAAPQAAPQAITPMPSDSPVTAAAQDGATTQSVWAHEQRLPTQAEESEYQSLRQMGMRKKGQPAPAPVHAAKRNTDL